MTENEAPITPILPIWAKEGNAVIEYRSESFTDRGGNDMMLQLVVWKDKKGKEHTSVHTVRHY